MARLPKNIVLIHDLWLTPRSWRQFKTFYEDCGYSVSAPGWPGICGDHEKSKSESSGLRGLGVEEIADHYQRVIHYMGEPPILMGHGFGGLIVQMLLDRGLGAAGVAIDSIVPRGCWKTSLPLGKAFALFLWNPLNYGGCVTLSFDRFYSLLANSLSAAEARVLYDEYVIPGPGRPLFQAALSNCLLDSALRVNRVNDSRAPLLLITGSHDHLVPIDSSRTNRKLYSHSTARTDYAAFADRSHMIIVEPGWEEIADFAVSWSLRQLRTGEVSLWRSREKASETSKAG